LLNCTPVTLKPERVVINLPRPCFNNYSFTRAVQVTYSVLRGGCHVEVAICQRMLPAV
jgi:hypothetical protein